MEIEEIHPIVKEKIHTRRKKETSALKKRYTFTRSGERGQALVELSISLVFLLILMSAVIDLGWSLYTLIAMQDSAQEGAIFASMCQNTSSILVRTQESTTEPLDASDISDISIVFLDEDGNPGGNVTYGSTVKVTLTLEHQILTPFVGAFIGNEGYYPLTASATSTIMRLETYCR